MEGNFHGSFFQFNRVLNANLNKKHNELIKISSIAYIGTGETKRIWHEIAGFQVYNGFIKPDNDVCVYGIDGGIGGFTSLEVCNVKNVKYYCILIGNHV